MRIDRLDLVRYGHFCGQTIDFPTRQPDYYLIYGDNEAGKSTLLRGISALLFGVPVKTPDVHSCKGPELRIGATVSDGKNHFSFRRRKGTTGTLLNLLEGQIPDDALSPFLRELDRDRFEQFFGLNHERLREGGEELLRGEGDVGSALFQAAGLLDLRRLLEKLDADAKELFSPQSRKKTISRIIEDYKLAKAQVRTLSISAASVKEKQVELEAAKEKLDSLKAESHSLRQDLVRLRRIESNKPDLANVSGLGAALAALETAPILPVDAGRQRDEARATLVNANMQIRKLTEDIAGRERRIQELPANTSLKGLEHEIEELNTATKGYLQSIQDRKKREHERDDFIELARSIWKEIWPQPVSEAQNLKNVYLGKQESLQLIAEHTGLAAELSSAEEELQNLIREQQRLEEQLAQQPDLADPAALIAAIEQAKLLGDTDRVAAKLRTDIERLIHNAQRAMRKLAHWTGSIQDLENLKSPLAATVDQYSREWENIAEKRRDLTVGHANLAAAILENKKELERLSAQVAGANELAAIRGQRDELWEAIKACAFDKTISHEEAVRRLRISGPLPATFEQHLHKADEIADLRFLNARDVAIHDRVAKEIAAAEAEQQRIESEAHRLEEAERELTERWNREWTALGWTPLSPLEMKEWMQERRAILDLLAQSHEKEHELQSLEERARAAAVQITAKWSAMELGVAPAEESFPVLLRMAESFARQRERERRATDDLRRQLKSLSVEKRRAKLEDCRRQLTTWSEKWTTQVRALRLPDSSTPEQVSRALTVLEKVFDALKDADRLQYRMKRMGDDIDAFVNRATKVVAAVAPSLASMDPDAAIRQLHSQVVELGNAETERKTLQEQNERDRATVAECREKVQQASATLDKLRVLANCKDDDEQQLDAAIAASEEKADKKLEYERIASALIARNANADFVQIDQEAAAYDLDSLRSEILTKEGRLNSSVEEISEAASNYGELSKEFEDLEKSEESALQAQKAEDALAQLRPAVEQYLRLRLASEVLQQAIESYRQKHQGPILTRASELFSRLTLGDHSSLASDFGDDDKPVLVAIRNNRERVQVGGLSDGTRDQLYLALRLAAIEHHIATVTPCPVILDDILIHSDDTRASAALQVIADLAKCTQVLFFTHHRRLAELGIQAGAQMIELGALNAAAVA